MGNNEFAPDAKPKVFKAGQIGEPTQEQIEQQVAALGQLLREGQAMIEQSNHSQDDLVTVGLNDAEMVAATQGATLFLSPEHARTMITKLAVAVKEQKIDGR